MAKIVQGAIVADDGNWYYDGFRWKALVAQPATKAPGLLSGEQRQASRLMLEVHGGDVKTGPIGEAGKKLMEVIAAGHSIYELESSASRQDDDSFAEAQKECPLPLKRLRGRLPGGTPLLDDEWIVDTAMHWGFSTDRLVLTTHRLVWSTGIVNKDSKQVYLTDIRQVTYHKPLIGTGTILVESASKDSLEGLVHMAFANRFRDSLQTMIHFAKQRSQHVTVHAQPVAAATSAPQPDRLDQLKKLADLKSQGILSDEEFQMEKAKILSS
ncbi:MAG TPA: SHOCT domain-containing protein [Candidatus Dormibacteraeota bacterium]|nr:SHOCT domain-containing protein [Candidatus Dormibacteraeota bacterium]